MGGACHKSRTHTKIVGCIRRELWHEKRKTRLVAEIFYLRRHDPSPIPESPLTSRKITIALLTPTRRLCHHHLLPPSALVHCSSHPKAIRSCLCQCISKQKRQKKRIGTGVWPRLPASAPTISVKWTGSDTDMWRAPPKGQEELGAGQGREACEWHRALSVFTCKIAAIPRRVSVSPSKSNSLY